MEELLKAGQNSEENVRWAAYLEELKRSDPEEYKLLMKDLQEFQQQKTQAENIVTPNSATATRENNGGEGDNNNIKMPGDPADSGEGVKVFPTPGFVLKTRTDKGDKIFINICQSPMIQKMSTKKKLADDGSEQEGLNIPLSLGPPRSDKDKAGEACIVYDIIVNPEVLENANNDKTGSSRTFLCELALQYVEQKYQCAVDYRYKLPKMIYKGDKEKIPYQLIRKQQAPVIEEIQESNSTNKLLNATNGTKTSNTKQKKRDPPTALAYSLMKYSVDDQGVESTVEPIEASLSDPILNPGDEHHQQDQQLGGLLVQAVLDRATEEPELLKHVKLSVSDSFMLLKIDGYYLPLELLLPVEVDTECIEAVYNSASKLLEVRLPALSIQNQSWRSSAKPDPGSRPWVLSRALEHAAGMNEGVSGPELQPQDDDGDGAKSKSPRNNKDESETSDVLPEDRFHLADMLSQHIKDERDRERKEKARRAEEEEKEKLEKEEKERIQERKDAIQKTLMQAEEELKASGKIEPIVQIDEDEEDDDSLLV